MLTYKIFNCFTMEVYTFVDFSSNLPIDEIVNKLNEIKKQYKDSGWQLMYNS